MKSTGVLQAVFRRLLAESQLTRYTLSQLLDEPAGG